MSRPDYNLHTQERALPRGSVLRFGRLPKD